MPGGELGVSFRQGSAFREGRAFLIGPVEPVYEGRFCQPLRGRIGLS